MSRNDGKRITAYSYNPFELCIIGGAKIPEGGGPVDTDDTDDHPLYDPRILTPLLESDIEDVKAHGVHTPIRVRKNGGMTEVVFGRKRVRIARFIWANFKIKIDVPTLYVAAKDDKDLFGLLISENEHRDEDTYPQKAAKALRYQKYGASDVEIARAFRFDSVLSAKNLLRYFDMAPDVQNAVLSGELNPSAAIPLTNLDRETQSTELKAMKKEAKSTGKAIKVAEVKRRVKIQSGDADAVVRPGIRVLKKLIATEEAEALPEGVVLGIRFCMGDLDAKQIKGMSAALRAASPPPAE